MSYTPFLNSVAEALMQRVHPAVADARSRDALEACVRALAGMAAALEVPSAASVEALPLPAGRRPPEMPLLVTSPPENLAANDQSAARIATGAIWLAEADWLNEPSAVAAARAMLSWERDILRTKIAAMGRIERASGETGGDLARLIIDRDALERYFVARCGPRSGARITEFRQTVGGRSRQTAVFTLEGETGLPRGLVVQRDHPASISSFGIADQFPVLELVSKTALKTSRPILLETDRSVLGAPFIVVEQARGTVAGPDYFDPPKSPSLALELAEQLAILHSVDPTPLIGKVKQTIEPGDPAGWRGELQQIAASWQKFQHAPSLAVTAGLAWMRAHVDAIGSELAIIHNDAAFHNILVEDGRFSSLLDWELVHIGHPAEDLGYCRPFVQEMTNWEDFLDAYRAAGGRRFETRVIDYFTLRGAIHLMTLLQYGRSMFVSGQTSDVLLAEAATAFIPKHHARIAAMVETVIGGKS